MEEEVSPQNISFPPSSPSRSSNDITKNGMKTSENSSNMDLKVQVEDLVRQISELKAVVENQKETIDEQTKKINKNDDEIIQLKKAHENEKEQILAQNFWLKYESEEQQSIINQLTYALKKMQTEHHQIKYQNIDLSDKIAILIQPNQICTISNAVVKNKIEYSRINGKILLINNLKFDDTKWIADDVKINFKDAAFKICITNKLFAVRTNLSPILNRIVYCTLKELALSEVTITFFEYKKLANGLRNIQLYWVTVRDKYGNEIEMIDLLKVIQKTVEYFKYVFKHGELVTGIAQKLSAFHRLPRLNKFYLWDIQEGFDLRTFDLFIHKNPNVTYWLDFKCSNKFYKQIQSIANEFAYPSLPETALLEISKDS